ncbi:MAG: hypothetical protein AAFX79_08625 [Planctomycetota bacterium]
MHRSRTARRLVVPVALLASTAAVLTGCTKANTYRSNLTPELATLYQRPTDVRNQSALANNENWRMLAQDFNRFFYLDRPSRLTREPIPR